VEIYGTEMLAPTVGLFCVNFINRVGVVAAVRNIYIYKYVCGKVVKDKNVTSKCTHRRITRL
jgi:hypothetical protein